MSRGRILVIRGGAIGDFILTLPALAALRKQFPQTYLEVLGYPHIASLATLAGSANAVRSIEAKALAGFFARGGELDGAMGDYFAGFNIILSYLYDPDEIFRTNVGRCSKAQFIAAPHRPSDDGEIHATDVLLRSLQQLAIFEADPTPRIDVGVSRDDRLIAVHPGSGSEKKNWPETQWAGLLRSIVAKTNWRVLIVGGEAEQDRLQRLASILPVDRLHIAVNQPLTTVARRLAGARAFIGHDSGITHLAAAVGTRTIVLWSETNEKVWAPRGVRVELLRDERGLPHLRTERVFAAAAKVVNDAEGSRM